MGVRPHLFFVSRPELVALVATPVDQLAERFGAVRREYHPGDFVYAIAGVSEPWLVDVRDPSASLGAHLASSPHDVYTVLAALTARGQAQHVACHRRWWIGSVAAALREEHRFDDEAAHVLGRLVGDFGCGDADVDRAANARFEDRVLSPGEDGVWLGEMPALELATVLERVAHRTTFGPPRGPVGIAPVTDAGWTEWVRGVVSTILRCAEASPDAWLVSYVS